MGLSSTALLGRADGQIPDRLPVVVLCAVPDLPVAEAMEQVKVALGRSLGEAGYTCVYLHHAGTATPLAGLWQHVQPTVAVAFGSLPPVDAQPLQRAEIPLLDRGFTPDNTRLTGLSQEDIGRLQIEHLAARGHRHIGYDAVDAPRERPFRQPRLQGATRACDELGLPAPQAVSMRYSRSSARDAVVEWTQDAAPVTAVAAFNDLIALAVLAIKIWTCSNVSATLVSPWTPSKPTPRAKVSTVDPRAPCPVTSSRSSTSTAVHPAA
ncbi:substrate-binding domain-containing protein [Streptomyces cellulosae]|uniref:Substrate-binding domain-containing protein n=1 Tax=Streptomyces cellulosae TaxID=1968 RepID=A0ABW7YG66_STRCE